MGGDHWLCLNDFAVLRDFLGDFVKMGEHIRTHMGEDHSLGTDRVGRRRDTRNGSRPCEKDDRGQ